MPRERLSTLGACIRSLANATDADTEFIIVNQGYTDAELADARKAVAPRECRVVHDGTFLPEGAARNLGLAAAKAASWVLLVDGEMTVATDCVTWMRRAAEETGAAFVMPLLLEREGMIHTTGAKWVWPDGNDGKLDHQEGHYMAWCPAQHDLGRQEVEVLETHILLVDRAQTGDAPFDNNHVHLFHFDVSLNAMKHDWKMVMEPAARAMFKRPPPISWRDYQYFQQRWNPQRFAEDSAYFQEKWGYDIRSQGLADWESFCLNEVSVFPARARNPVTQPVSNAVNWSWQQLRKAQRARGMRDSGGMMTLSSAETPRTILPKVCVVVASKDRPELLERSLNSILANAYPNFEIVVVEQSDTAASVSLENPRQHRIRRYTQATRGKSRALNAALDETDAQLILFTDDDCTVPESWVADAVDTLQSHTEAVALFGALVAAPHDKTEMYIPECDPGEERVVGGTLRRFAGASAIVGANMMFRADVFKALGGFDEALSPGGHYGTAEDMDLSFRMLRGGYRYIETRNLHVTHWGGRHFENGEVRDLMVMTHRAIGAMYARNLRAGDAGAFVAIASVLGVQLASVGRALVKRERPVGVRRPVSFVAGVARGLVEWKGHPRRGEQAPLVLAEDSAYSWPVVEKKPASIA